MVSNADIGRENSNSSLKNVNLALSSLAMSLKLDVVNEF